MNESDQIIEFIVQNHASLADMARRTYGERGRGVLRIEFPRIPPGTTLVGTAETTYTDLDELRAMVTPTEQAGLTTLIRLVEVYDGESHAVVLARITGGDPVTLKMRLLAPPHFDDHRGN